jgi:hypothetical protein
VPKERSHPAGDGDGHFACVIGINSKTDRLGRIEDALESIHQTLEVQFKRIAAMQAEIDLLRAKRLP